MASSPPTETAPRLAFVRSRDSLTIQLAGTWRLTAPLLVAARQVRHELDEERPREIEFDTSGVVAWDSALVVFAAQVTTLARGVDATVDRGGLPAGVQRLLALAEATPKHATQPPARRPPWIDRIGTRTIGQARDVTDIVRWIGDLGVAFASLVVGRAKFWRSDLFLHMQLAGANAFWIVSLVAGLFGLIIAFVAAVQLQKFAATLYVADLVGIAMIREMGAIMAAIVIAGRTGAAFAAELGSMRVTQELDAFATLGISPVQFLVLPRVLAVTVMMPLLCIYADVMGLLGGAVVGIGVMDISPRVYAEQTIEAVTIGDLVGGMFKATTYGFLIAVAACFEGMRAGRTAAAVGKAATSAVVDGIVLTIAMCGVFAVIFYRLGI